MGNIMYIKREGYNTIPDIQLEWGAGRAKMYINGGNEEPDSDEIPRIMMFCPCCGTEQVVFWENYSIAIHAESYESDADKVARQNAIDELEKKYSYGEIIKRVIKDIMIYSDGDTCKCQCCGTPIKLSPGYYYNSCEEFLSRLIVYVELYSEAEKIWEEHYDSTGNFLGYHDAELANSFVSKNKYAQEHQQKNMQDCIYSYNEISRNYINSHIFENNKNEITHIRYCSINDKGNESTDVMFLNIEEVFSMMREYRRILYKPARVQAVEKLAKTYERDSKNRHSTDSELNEELSRQTLKQYLRNLIEIEANIYALKQWLPVLYFVNEECGNPYRRLLSCVSEENALQESENELASIKEEIKRLTEDANSWKQYYCKMCKEEVISDKQIQSVKKPIEPSAPALQTPRLFNKKKVQEENERITSEYNQRLAKYEKDMYEYNMEVELLKDRKQKQEQDIERRAKEKVSDIINELREKEQIASERVETAKQSLANKKQMQNTPIEDSFCEKEIKEAEELLKKYIDAKYEYESHNFVFAKYRDFVAYSSFYEYLESGRVETLSGKDGAYNLYETEMRQNTVISQLSQVIESLEDIKDNQYIIYSKVTEINEELCALNDSMNTAVSALKNMEFVGNEISEALKRVEKSNEIIAYNTERSAYYSKMNTQLMNSLGFLVAFK